MASAKDEVMAPAEEANDAEMQDDHAADVAPVPAGAPTSLGPGATAGATGADAEAAAAAPVGADGEGTDDEVVQECDVYLNRMHDPPDFVGDMYVLQYPLRPCYRPYGDQGDLDRVDFKRNSRRLRFVYKLNHNDNYDEDGVASDKLGKRHVLDSAVVANPACSYAIAVVHQGKMTLMPVRGINQLRPDFEDFDKFKAAMSRGIGSVGGPEVAEKAEGADSDSGHEESALATMDLISAAPVRVEFTPGTRRPGEAPQEADEPWVRLDYYNRNSTEANDIYMKHIVWPSAAAAEAELENHEPDHPKLQKLELDGDRQTFLGMMCGQSMPRRRERKEEANDGLSVYMLSRMPVERQVEAVVRHFGVVSYARQLRKRLPPGTLRKLGNDEALIGHLRRCAVLINGNWVLKSELAGFEGAEAHARDMLMCILSKKKDGLRQAEFDKWNEAFQGVTQKPVRDEMARGIMERDGDIRRLKNPPDEDFERRFPQVVEEYSKWWDRHRLEVLAKHGAAKKNLGAGGAAAASQAGAALRQRARMLQEVQQLLTEGGRTVAELKRCLQKSNPTVVIKEDDIVQVLQHRDLGAILIRDLWVLERTGNEDSDRFRAALASLFRVRDCVSKRDILAEYERLHGSPCKLSEYQMRAMLRELADRADGENFVLKGALVRNG